MNSKNKSVGFTERHHFSPYSAHWQQEWSGKNTVNLDSNNGN